MHFTDIRRAVERREPRRPRLLELLWRVQQLAPLSVVSAGIYETPFGVELRIEQDGDLVQSRLFKSDRAALVNDTERRKADLIAAGWKDVDG